MKRDIVILALSAKNYDYCVAGIDVRTNEWVRPYSRNKATEGAIPAEHITYSNGTKIQYLI